MLSKEAKERMLEVRLKHESLIAHSSNILDHLDKLEVPSTHELLKELTIPVKYKGLFVSDSAIS
jgi:hypothetical protein